MQDLSITLVQAPLAWHSPAANRAYFAGILRDLREPTDLVILPEMFTTGFTMDTAGQSETMSGETIAWLAATARDHAVTICGSIVIAADGHYYNRLLWMPPDGPPGWYDKRHLFRMAGEDRHFTAGRTRALFHLQGWRVCPLICYDLRFPVWSRGANAYDLAIYVANWPATRRSAWQALLPARAVENQCYVAGVNRLGNDGNGVAYAGDSAVYDHLGNALLNCGDQPAAATVRLDRTALDGYREKFPAWRDADSFHLQ